MKKCAFFVLLVLLPCLVFANTAPPKPFQVQQPDGTVIDVRMFGDEYGKWMQTLDGQVIIDKLDANNNVWWYYARLDRNDRLVPTNAVVGKDSPIGAADPTTVRERMGRKAQLQRNEELNFTYGSMLPGNNNQSFGTDMVTIPPQMKPLVILVNFSGALPAGMPEHSITKEHFTRLFFEQGLNPSGQPQLPNNYTRSVYDYFWEVSRGQFSIQGNESSVVDWVTPSNTYTYYVNGSSGKGTSDIKKSALAALVELAQNYDNQIDFSNFDSNNDGFVDCVLLVMEGWADGSANNFWSFMSVASPSQVKAIDSSAPVNSSGFLTLDNTSIKSFIVTTEKTYFNTGDANKGYIRPIGTFCHELGHNIGLPDLYDTSSANAAGIGYWGLMGSGDWCAPTSPAYPCAWSRDRLGWIEPQILTGLDQENMNIAPAELTTSDPVAYKIYLSSDNSDEYFLLENRQQLGSDQFAQGTGLLIWHIDDNITPMYPAYNRLNIYPSMYGVNLLQADGNGSLYLSPITDLNADDGDSGDPFPGSKNNNTFTDNTTPAAQTYSYDRDANGVLDSARNSGIKIENIRESGDNIYASITCPSNLNLAYQIFYDEGDYEGAAASWGDNLAAITITPPVDSYLRYVKTFVRPSTSSANLKSVNVKIFRGFDTKKGKPGTLLYNAKETFDWSADEREWGWVTLAIKQDIQCTKGTVYYIELEYNGNGAVIPADIGFYTGSVSSGNSWWRSNILNSATVLDQGDWNIRALLEEVIQPNLAVQSITAPATARIGDDLAPLIDAIIVNDGKAAADSFSTIFYISTDSAITKADKRLAKSQNKITGLNPGATFDCSFAEPVVIPSTIKTGNYFIGALTDVFTAVTEGDENDNYRSARITIKPDNTPPDFNKTLPALTMSEDHSLQYPVTNWYSYVVDATHTDAELTYSIKSGSNVNAVINNNICTFTVKPDFFGKDTLQLKASDGEYADSANFTITVRPINDAPVITGLPKTLNFESDSTVTLTMSSYVQDIDSKKLAWTFQCNNANLQRNYTAATTVLSLKAPDYGGTAQLICTVADDSSDSDVDTIAVTITRSNRPPVFTAALPELVMNEDDSLLVPFSFWHPYVEDVTDPDSVLQYTIENGKFTQVNYKTNAVLLKTKNNDLFGLDTLQLIANDGEFADSAEFVFRVNPVNDPPDIVNLPGTLEFKSDSTVTLNMKSFAQDKDSNILFWSFSADNPALHVAYDSIQTKLELSAPDFAGIVHLLCTVKDDSLAVASSTITLKISLANKPPVFIYSLPELVMNEDDSLWVPFSFWYPWVEDPTDPDSVLTYSTTAGSHVTFKYVPRGILYYPTEANTFGRDTLCVKASDGEFADSAFFAFYTRPINDAPVISGLPDSVVFTNDSTVVLLMSDYGSDIDSPNLTWMIHISNSNIQYTYDEAAQTLTLNASLNYVGLASLVCHVIDDSSAFATDSLFIRVYNRTGIKDDGQKIPVAFGLYQNYPNPFNPVTTISYDIPKECFVELKLYNINGQLVDELVAETKKPGRYTLQWDAINHPSGVYMYQIKAGDFTDSKKVMLLK